MTFKLKPFLASCALGLLLAACGGSGGGTPDASGSSSSSSSSSGSGSSSSSSSSSGSGSSSSGSSSSSSGGGTTASVGHVFVIILENEDYTTSFGSSSPAPYLAKTLVAQGALLPKYYGTGHESNDNYISMISGQGPNPDTQADCQVFSNFQGSGAESSLTGQAVGIGCVFASNVPALPDQLKAHNLSWKSYNEDMGNTPSRESATCGHPALNSQDGTQSATAADNYATRHNPFVYFHSVIDDTAYCNAHVVSLKPLATDLASLDTTPSFVFITPSLCHDGHDSPCADGEPGGLKSADAFLQVVVPQIEQSPAFQKDGLLIITFDESGGPQSDASACCGEGPGPNSPLPGIAGLGGGVVGAVAISPYIKPGTVSGTSYNHYSLLRTIEDLFGLDYLGYAGASGQASFGADVFSAAMPAFPPKGTGSSSGSSSSGSSSSGSSSSGALPIPVSAGNAVRQLRGN
jgi:hypothetical protein